MSMTLRNYMKDHLLFLDGGTGTLLQAKGLAAGELPERWNLTHAEAVREAHRAYFDAGSNVVMTNTFGANGLKFTPEELEAIVTAAVDNARAARDASVGTQEKFIALDIGPCGRMLRPYGDLDFEDAVSLFAEVVKIGARRGVDLVMIETMNDGYETKAALLAARENCDLPVLVTNAYGADGKLLTGASPAVMAAMLTGLGADAIGANCSLGPAQLREITKELAAHASVPVILKPNAGLPRVDERSGKTVFDVTPEEFAAETAKAVADGVRVLGGCCGTTPAHIRALTAALAGVSPLPILPKHETVIASGSRTVTFGGSPILIGERINPTGKKRFKQALAEHDIDYILREGVSETEQGADVLDVNVGLPGIDEAEMLRLAVEGLQTVTDLPLQIDTADPVAMEAALRRYNGKAMINSVNGKAESMRAVFPLVKKYGGLVVVLTLDEAGIPATAEGRLAIARKIKKEARRYGIHAEDLIFDPLAMTVSADANAARVTLDAVRLIREKLGCRTSLGVSNVSFGLPSRDTVTASFFALALGAGLDAAIMNPYSTPMQDVYHACRALRGQDENCARYIAYATRNADETAGKGGTVGVLEVSLRDAVCKGLKESAAQRAEELLATVAPLTVVEEHIMPALDEVGKGFEAKTIYLPQLLMSAEAAKAAFECVKRKMQASGNGSPDRFTVVLATVRGDIHDIGKNIVKLLLENYGFRVVDLGKDVPPEEVVHAARETGAPLVGLSALMTTTVPAMEETIKALRREVPACRIVVGGAVLNEEYAARIGADRYAEDAMETVRYAEELEKE